MQKEYYYKFIICSNFLCCTGSRRHIQSSWTDPLTSQLCLCLPFATQNAACYYELAECLSVNGLETI